MILGRLLRWIKGSCSPKVWRGSGDVPSQPQILCEDFLKALYNQSHLQEVDETLLAKVIEVAGIPTEKVAEVIGHLMLEKYITLNPLSLTPQGEKRALSLLRRHRIYEKYLAEHSGYSAQEWHFIAEEMEHRLEEREHSQITSILRNPLWDPHGDPIPMKGNSIPQAGQTSLQGIQAGAWYRVLHVEDEHEEAFRLMTAMGVSCGTIIHVLDLRACSLVFECEGERYSIPLEVLHALNLTYLPSDSPEVADVLGIKRLTDLREGEEGVISKLSPACVGAMRRRLMDLGFVRGSTISIDMTSPMGNPTAYLIRNTAIALRADQARYILIRKK